MSWFIVLALIITAANASTEHNDVAIGGADEPRSGGTLRLGNRADVPAGWDPMRTSSIALHHVAGSVFGAGNLVKRCRDDFDQVCPYVATAWHSNHDDTRWTFDIRRGVLWHDGTPFTADDVRFWLELAVHGTTVGGATRAPAYFAGSLGAITSVEVIGDQLSVVFAEPTTRFPETLLDPRIKIAHPRHLMEPRIAAGDVTVSPLDVGLVGIGPFQVVRNEPGSLVQVRRFEAYWERDERGVPLPYLHGIDFFITPDPTAMDLAMRTGRLDGGARGEGHYLSAEREAVYDRTMADQVVMARIGGGTFRLAFNMLRDGPWQDVRVRRALSLWIDSEAAVVGALGGQGFVRPSEAPWAPSDTRPFKLWPRSDTDELDERRIEARRLMREAGYAEGFSMQYLCRAQHLVRCEFMQGHLVDLGVRLQLRVVDETTWGQARFGLDHDTQSGANFSSLVPEATQAVYGVYAMNPDAYAKHDDAVVTELYRRLRSTSTGEDRIAVWHELERHLVHEQVYIVPIAASIQVVPYRSHVRGLVIPPEDGHAHTDFATVWLEPGAGPAPR